MFGKNIQKKMPKLHSYIQKILNSSYVYHKVAVSHFVTGITVIKRCLLRRNFALYVRGRERRITMFIISLADLAYCESVTRN